MLRKILIFLSFPLYVSAQTNSEYYYEKKAEFKGGSIDKYMYTQITYPLPDLKKKKQSTVLVSIKVKSDGSLDSIVPLISESKEATAELMQAIRSTDGFWRPTIIGGKPEDYTYKIACYYRLNVNSNPETAFQLANRFFIEKEYEKAVDAGKQAMRDFPYEPQIYLLVARAYKALKDEQMMNMFFKKYSELNKTFLANLYINAFGMTRSERVISRRPRRF